MKLLKRVMNIALCFFGIHEVNETTEVVTCIHCGDKILLSKSIRLSK